MRREKEGSFGLFCICNHSIHCLKRAISCGSWQIKAKQARWQALSLSLFARRLIVFDLTEEIRCEDEAV